MIVLRNKLFGRGIVSKEASKNFFKKVNSRIEKNRLHDEGQRKMLESLVERNKKAGVQYNPDAIALLPLKNPGKHKNLLRNLIDRRRMLESGPGSYGEVFSPREKLHIKITQKSLKQ